MNCWNFIECECFLELNPPDNLALCETNLNGSIYSGNFSVRGYIPLIQMDSITHPYAWSCSLCERRTSFCMGLISRKLFKFLRMFSTGFTSLSVLLLFSLSIIFFYAQFFYPVSSNIDEALLINPSANVFVFS